LFPFFEVANLLSADKKFLVAARSLEFACSQTFEVWKPVVVIVFGVFVAE
jgi:hypothetical protein